MDGPENHIVATGIEDSATGKVRPLTDAEKQIAYDLGIAIVDSDQSKGAAEGLKCCSVTATPIVPSVPTMPTIPTMAAAPTATKPLAIPTIPALNMPNLPKVAPLTPAQPGVGLAIPKM